MLTKKEKEILTLRKKGLKQSEIASHLKISQPAVSAFENNALKKIREAQRTIAFIEKIGLEVEDE